MRVCVSIRSFFVIDFNIRRKYKPGFAGVEKVILSALVGISERLIRLDHLIEFRDVSRFHMVGVVFLRKKAIGSFQ